MLQLRCRYTAFHIQESVRWSAQSAWKSHWVGLRVNNGGHNFDQPAIAVLAFPGGIPFEIIVRRVFLPMWIILVPVSPAGARWSAPPEKLADGVIAAQKCSSDTSGDGGAGFRLRP